MEGMLATEGGTGISSPRRSPAAPRSPRPTSPTSRPRPWPTSSRRWPTRRRVRIVNMLVNAAGIRLRLRLHAAPRPVAADRELPPGEAAQGRPARPRAARHVGLLLAQPFGARATWPGCSTPKEACHDRRHRAARRGSGPLRRVGAGRDQRDGSGVRLQPPGHDLRRRGTRLRRGAVRRRSTSEPSPQTPCSPAWAVGTPRRWPTCTRARPCSTSAPAAASTSCCRRERVGPTGKVYGLDMTEEMLALALENKKEAGVTNVEFLKGYIEDIPLPAQHGRRRDLELRGQPVDGQGEGVRRDRPGAEARRPHRHQRRGGRRRAHARAARRARQLRRVHRRAR